MPKLSAISPKLFKFIIPKNKYLGKSPLPFTPYILFHLAIAGLSLAYFKNTAGSSVA
jgi:hypothetical protein